MSDTAGERSDRWGRPWPPLGAGVAAALTSLYGLVFVVGGATARSVLGVGYGLVLVAVAALLWKRHRWGWWGAMAVYGLGALFAMSNILAGDSRFAVAVVVSLLVLLYLLTHYEYFFPNAGVSESDGEDAVGKDNSSIRDSENAGTDGADDASADGTSAEGEDATASE